MLQWRFTRATVATGLLAAALVTSAVSASSGAAGTPLPNIGVRAVMHHVEVIHYSGATDIMITPGIYAGPTNGAFEIDVTGGPEGPYRIAQVVRDSTGVHHIRSLTATAPIHLGEGLPGFFHATLRNARGVVVADTTMPFCPANSFSLARTDSSGPDRPTFPLSCGSNLAHAAIWGIDPGWGFPLDLDMRFGKDRPDGNYILTIAIAPRYARQLHVRASAAVATVGVTVTTDSGGGCNPELPPCPARLPRPATAAQRIRQGEGPDASARSTFASNGLTGVSGVPDMRALPAHDLSTERGRFDKRDYLNFAATLFNAGSGPLVLEGFRSGDAAIMPATQFIYRNGHPVRSHPAGQFEFDTRPGHHHWHMEDIAQYDLLDAHGNRVLLSGKQSFCLAPTDPIDLTLPGADWQPDQAALWSACYGADAIWLREVLPAGWGDTYYQSVAGQAFDITTVPNGHYIVRVTTDPEHHLLETSYVNNVSLLKITLGGARGHRTVHITPAA